MSGGEAKLLGRWGEALAAAELRRKGWKVLAAGYRSRFGEIDLIAATDTVSYTHLQQLNEVTGQGLQIHDFVLYSASKGQMDAGSLVLKLGPEDAWGIQKLQPGIHTYPLFAPGDARPVADVYKRQAYAEFNEDIKGSLEVGKLADFAVIDRDLMTCPAEYIKDTQVLLTVSGGEEVYRKDASVPTVMWNGLVQSFNNKLVVEQMCIRDRSSGRSGGFRTGFWKIRQAVCRNS